MDFDIGYLGSPGMRIVEPIHNGGKEMRFWHKEWACHRDRLWSTCESTAVPPEPQKMIGNQTISKACNTLYLYYVSCGSFCVVEG